LWEYGGRVCGAHVATAGLERAFSVFDEDFSKHFGIEVSPHAEILKLFGKKSVSCQKKMSRFQESVIG
jgi:hypothetical protein